MIVGLVEDDRGKPSALSLEMLTLARRLAEALPAPLHAILIGEGARQVADRLRAYGVSTVHLVRHEGLGDYAPAAWAQSVIEIMARLAPQVVLAAGSERGQEVMAHVAARRNLPLAANCTDVRPGDPYVVTRQRWGGTLLEDARLQGAVKLLTVAPHVIEAEEAAGPGDVTIDTVVPILADTDFRGRVARRIDSGAGKASLAEAKVVVGGGRGVGSAEGFGALEELAQLLGGVVGCSRAVTSLGWRPHADQVGQTGTRIAPDIYIACGISGAVQHMVGCKGAKHILAINTDPEAPMVAAADSAIIGDLRQVVPALSQAIRVARGA